MHIDETKEVMVNTLISVFFTFKVMGVIVWIVDYASKYIVEMIGKGYGFF